VTGTFESLDASRAFSVWSKLRAANLSPVGSCPDEHMGNFMKSRKPSRKQIRGLCGDVHPDDGIDPRDLARRAAQAASGGRSRGRKTMQLCGQVARALDQALAGSRDDVLRNLYVVLVESTGDLTRLVVTVSPHPALGPEEVDPVRALEHLGAAAGGLRAEVAAAITRRRAPTLDFRYAIATGGPSA
jgi:ribosome-binding factor A